MGDSMTSRMVMLEMVMSSQSAPSTDSSAKPVAAFEDAVGDGDVLEAAVGFGAALDAAGAADALGVGGELLAGAVEHGAQLVGAGDVAVGDGEVLGGAGVAEGEAATWGRCRRPTAS